MIEPAIVIVDDFPQVLDKLKNDLEQKYSDHFRIIEADSGQQEVSMLATAFAGLSPADTRQRA